MNDGDEKFLTFKAGNDCRTPLEILIHLNQVANYALSIVDVEIVKISSENPQMKFVALYKALSEHLKLNELPESQLQQIINGPLSDALTHIGQLAMLRRLSNNPIKWENYSKVTPEI